MVVTDGNADRLLPQPGPAAQASMPPTPPAEEKPYHAKRPHRKSRLGCRNCKARKVKCDEKKPSCRNCTLRRETCAYPSPPVSQSQSRSQPQSQSQSQSQSHHPHSSAPPTTTGSARASASTSAAPPPAAQAAISTPPASFSALSSDRLRLVHTPVSPPVSSASPRSQHATVPPGTTSLWLSPARRRNVELAIVDEPSFRLGGADDFDMKLLWFYTTETYMSFSIEAGKIPHIDRILKSDIVKFAFQSRFLMDCILGLSAQHMQSMNLPVPMSRALAYRARAFNGYRRAIETADPKDFPALLVCSLLLCALSSELFREGDMRPLYVVDWMVVWRGIGLIFELIPPELLFEAGLEKLFSRPAFDLNQAALHIPPNLLFMVTSIKEGDPDHPFVDTYYDTLKYLGGLYRELENGFSPVLSMRIITWFTFLPKPFVELAKKRRPRALVIIAHYLVFLRLAENVWWLIGVSCRGIQDIIDYMPPEWQRLLDVPRMSMQVNDRVELAKLIEGNHAWEPSTDKSKIVPKLNIVNDKGEPVSWVRERGWVPVVHAAQSGDGAPTAQSGPSTPSVSHGGNLSPPGS